MIPLRLRLKNFMSYAELDLDLRGIHTAVLTGPNGAGKSSLLDAITYAIWDKARASADQLVRLGQNEMWVELIFAVDGRIYRLWRRKLTRKGAPAQLEFHQAIDPAAALVDDPTAPGEADEASYVALTGASVRETQARILQTVHMDYDTFTNSAFILQGRADQFTTKTPRERKALLGEILGLQHYDELAQAARERHRAAQQRAADLEAEQAGLRERVAGRPALEAELAAAQDGIASLNMMIAQADQRQTRLKTEEAALRSAEAEVAKAEADRQAAADTVRRVDVELAARRAAIADATERVAARSETEAAYAEWQAVQADEGAARRRADAWQAAEREVVQATSARQNALHAIDLALSRARLAREALAKEAAGIAAAVADRPRTEQAWAALEAARADEAAWAAKQRADRELEAEQRRLEAALATWQARVDAERREQTARSKATRQEAAERPAVERALAGVRAELTTLAEAAAEQERVQEQGHGDRGARDKADLALAQARQGIQAVDAKLAQLEVTLEIHGAGDPGRSPLHRQVHKSTACPLCETPLSEADLAKIQAQYARERAEHEDLAVRLEKKLAHLDQALAHTRARFKELKELLKGREALQRKELELEGRLAAVERAEALAAHLDAAIAEEATPPLDVSAALAGVAEGRLALGLDPAAADAARERAAQHAWAEAAQWKLNAADERTAAIAAEAPALDAEIAAQQAAQQAAITEHDALISRLRATQAATGHEPEAHAALRARMDALADAPERWSQLQQDLIGLEGAKAQAAALEAERLRHELAAATADRAIVEGRARLDRLPDWQREAAAAEAEIKRLREEERARHAEVGRLGNELARLAAEAAKLAAREGEWKAAIEDVQAFKELTQAFGKEGIQALIIENALPELEEEANRLLARISDNRMHVRLATQREKKTGGVAETLEIHISDEVGTRNYELYSGGEAFRVNFALRLALSRLLARRAGARLQTLVIDEGFGTQDDRGRERLVEAINGVADEFERILVITHIRELKDAFNTQIEVTKRGGVSEVRLSA